MASEKLRLVAPLSGVVVPIDTVPDPVFASKMVGDGVSIDPVAGELVAPCDGEVVVVQPTNHAVTIRSSGGAEILMHIGLETVSMEGKGFTSHVSAGQRVNVGESLISFDLETVADEAKSLLTQIVITNTDDVESLAFESGVVSAGTSPLGQIVMKPRGDAPAPSVSGESYESDDIVIGNPTGLHARPAATLVGLAKNYESAITIKRGADSGNARSVIAILAMAIAKGDVVTVSAVGSDAEKAASEIAEAIRGGLGEEVEAVEPNREPAPVAAPEPKRASLEPVDEDTPISGDEDLLIGVAASPGLGLGQIVQVRKTEFKIDEHASDPSEQAAMLKAAIAHSTEELSSLEKKLSEQADPEKAAIFAAHKELLGDPDLMELALGAIERGKSAAFAWRGAYMSFADQLAGLSNEIMAGRATDVRDVGQRVLEELTGQRAETQELAENTILIAEDLTPSDTATMDRSKVAGFATTTGGASSHVAILARSLDIPAIAGIEPRALKIADGTRVILDGTRGTLRKNVSEAEVENIRARQIKIAERRAVELSHAHETAQTTDGHSVDVVANIGGIDDAKEAKEKGAEGVGLLRSEFLFLGRDTAPTEDEQAEIYHAIGSVMPGKPLVIRTLDVGGDKPLPYLPIPHEENPFLGQRGIRVGLDRPEILRTQIRAILRASDAGAQIHVMFPMISTLRDFRSAKEIFEDERKKMGVAEIPLGVMVEVPSVAVMAEQFAREVSFFSVGTNDLTQYTLAMDRGHPALAPQVDAVNPAVLALIGRAAEAAHKYDRWIGVCGGVASDPQAIPLLVGLGVDELSASIPAIPSVKAQVRSYSKAQCDDLAQSAIRKDTALAVRDLVPLDED